MGIKRTPYHKGKEMDSSQSAERYMKMERRKLFLTKPNLPIYEAVS
jgi:hypothetical protein